MTDTLFDSLMEARRGIAHTMFARRLRECPSGSRWRPVILGEWLVILLGTNKSERDSNPGAV